MNSVQQRPAWQLRAKHFLPFLTWLPELRHWVVFKADLIAGFTVAMLLIPQSLAYAHLAGLPVYMGLYAAFLPPIIAALFGSSRVLSTGPVPVSSLLTATALVPLVATGTTEYIQYAILLTFLAGMIQLAFGLLRFGVVVNFLSHPVILGFTNAVAIIIASMQLSNLFGVYAVMAPRYYQTLWQVLTDAVSSTHWPTLIIALIALVIILGGRKFRPDWPHTLLAVVITSVIAWATGYEQLETIEVSQIINPPIQQMLANYEQYPQVLKQALAEVATTQQLVQKTIQRAGADADQTDSALNAASQAKWQLERQIARHTLEEGELNRMRLRRLVARDGQEVFYIEEQMTPIGFVDPNVWRLDSFPERGRLVVRAGGEVVGAVARGLPSFKAITLQWDVASKLFMAALVLALLGFTEAVTIAKRIATETRQQLNINQELLGQGLAKCVGSFFQSMPVSGGFTRTAVNFYAGAKTGFASIVAGLVVMAVLLWLTPLLYYLPYATLAVVIMVGVLGILNLPEMYRIWQLSRNEGLVSVATFLLTLFLAPRLAHAVILGMLLSLGVYLYETMRPRFCELMRNDEGDLVEVTEQDVETNPCCEQASIVRFNGALYFASAAYFEEKILELISQRQKLRYIILDCSSMNKLDASGLEVLRSIHARLSDAGIALWFTRVRQPVMSVLKRAGVYEVFGTAHFFKNNELALLQLGENLGKQHRKACALLKLPLM